MKNLGKLTKPLMVFGGPYSNLDATKAIYNEASRLGFERTHIICTGDIVAYCAEPEETCALINEWGIHVVMGNCEESLGFDESDCGCGFDEGSACSTLSVTWYEFARRRVNLEYRQWMKKLPRSISFQMADKRFQVVHGGVEQINQFIFKSTNSEEKRRQINAANCDVIIGGHSGLAFGETLGEQAWLNAGVIGMPANDGSPDGWYMIVKPLNDQIEVSWHRLAFDVLNSQKLTQKAGMTEYAQSLLTGLWPNMDILPKQEQAGQGLLRDPDPLLIG